MDLRIKCNKCSYEFEVDLDKLNFDWFVDSTNEREMGTETCWLSTVIVECPVCDAELNIEFRIWEYPVGAFNYSHATSDDAKILDEPSLEKYIDLTDTPNNN